MIATKQQDWRRWLGRGAWAIADQGLFALSSALLNILLARWLVPSQYGAFAVAYSVFLFIGACHTALFTEPMLVFGSDRYAARLSGYMRVLVRGHWMLTGMGSLLLVFAGVICWLKGAEVSAQISLGLAVAAPFTLLLWLMRRASYVRLQPQLATTASAIYLTLTMTGLFTLNYYQEISVLSVMLSMGLSSAVAGLWLKWRLCTQAVIDEADVERPARRAVLLDHWNYGRWALATSILMWVPLNFYFIVLSGWVNLEASATLKALTNLVLPLLQANAALSALLVPSLVIRAGNTIAFRHLLLSALILFFAGAALYALFIGILGRPLVHLLYGGKYDGSASLLWLLALLPVLDGMAVVFASALRSLERPNLVFWANLCAAACVLTMGIWATSRWGLAGAASGMVLADLLAVALLGLSVYMCLRPVSLALKTPAANLARS
jgi:O-antigen/teichoic acid export membrane protein